MTATHRGDSTHRDAMFNAMTSRRQRQTQFPASATVLAGKILRPLVRSVVKCVLLLLASSIFRVGRVACCLLQRNVLIKTRSVGRSRFCYQAGSEKKYVRGNATHCCESSLAATQCEARQQQQQQQTADTCSSVQLCSSTVQPSCRHHTQAAVHTVHSGCWRPPTTHAAEVSVTFMPTT